MSTGPAPPPDISEAEGRHLVTGMMALAMVLWLSVGHAAAARSRYVGAGMAAATAGLALGAALLAARGLGFLPPTAADRLMTFNASTFFVFLLPPIILQAGLAVRQLPFFANLATISVMGIGGTYASFAVVAAGLAAFAGLVGSGGGGPGAPRLLGLADCLALGAIFAATDSVAVLQVLEPERAPMLFNLVFGEGVINDATTIALLHTVKALGPSPRMDASTVGGMLASFFILFAASLTLGVALGLGGAWLIKATRNGSNHSSAPAAIGLICTSAYTAYLAGDASGLSGIVSLFCAAVVLAHYGLPSLTRADRTAVRATVGAASLVAEGAIFAFVGLAALDPGQWGQTHWPAAAGVAALVLILMLTSRAAWLAPVLAGHNAWAGTAPLNNRAAGVAWWAGSMRGAVSVALVCFYYGDGQAGFGDDLGGGISTPSKAATLVSATLIVVLVSTLGFGAVTKPVLKVLLGSGHGGGEAAASSSLPSITTRPGSRASAGGGGLEPGRGGGGLELAAPAKARLASPPPAGSAALSIPRPPHLTDQGSMEEVSLLGGSSGNHGAGEGSEDPAPAAAAPAPSHSDPAARLVAAAWPQPPPRPPPPPPPPPTAPLPPAWRRAGPVAGDAAPTPSPPPPQREFVDWWTAFDARVMRPVFSRGGEGGRGGSGGGDEDGAGY